MDWLVTLCVIAAPVLATRAFFRTRALTATILALKANVEVLDQRLSRLEDPQASVSEAPSAEALLPEETASELTPFRAQIAAPLPPAPPGKGWEQILVENWLVWLGGVALALGGAFLVKLSIDYGLLTPAVRVALGMLLGLALWAGAEWIVWGEPAEIRPSNVSQALAAAGAATIFASLYAAYQLYGLLAPALAFPLLALTAAATVLMSLQLGPFVAVLGLAGAFAVPAMVRSEQPSAFALFAYLILVGAGSLALLRHRAWWWLAWIALAGSIGWALTWLAMSYDPADVWAVGGFLLAQIGLFTALRRGIPGVPFLEGVIDEPAVRAVVRTAFWAIVLAVLMLVQADSDGTAALGCAFLTVFSLLAFAYRDSRLDDILAAAGTLAAALLACWRLPLPAAQRVGLLHNLPPEEVGRFLTVAIAFGGLLGAGGFAVLARVPRPSRWAALSAAAPPLLLAVSYWRTAAFGLDLDWTIVALALAASELAAAYWVAQRRDGEAENELVLAAYAVGVLGCTILAAVFVLENAWLTVALAMHLPALAWIEGRLQLPVLRRVALGIAAAVLVRLTLNSEVLRYALSDTLIFNWLLYGYGVPAAAFILATRQFGSGADDLLVKVLEGGSVAFSVLLVTLELWHAMSDRPLRFALDDFDLNAVETIAWLAMAGWLLYLGERRDRVVLRWSGVILFASATVFAVGWQAIFLNPVMPLFGRPVEGWFLLDTLFSAYAIPAALFAVIGIYRLGPRVLWQAALVLAVGFAFLWVTLEVRHFFQGDRLNQGLTGEAEWYVYSAAWLAFAAAGLGAALKWRSLWLRRASLLGLGLVVGKVFLSDMADLSGALRALSFIGLGLVLVGIGYAYRRLQPLQPNPETTS
ncbi:MAG: DUF2339 domain-containing protein [Alphaproteobacteria bacterium]|nr:DUF2339 domain-containing protein [Alphaproteobacteria bacterium]